MFENNELGAVQLVGYEAGDFPILSINQYVKIFCENYAKLVIVNKINDLIRNEKRVCISLDQNSFPLVPSIFPTRSFNIQRQIRMTLTESTCSEFFRRLLKYSRPIVYLHEQNKISYIYDYNDKSAVKLTELTYKCPPTFLFTGLASVIRELASANWEYEEHKKKMLIYEQQIKLNNIEIEKQSLELEKWRKIVNETGNSVEPPINDPPKPATVNELQKEFQNKILERQGRYNYQFGIREYEHRFDIKV